MEPNFIEELWESVRNAHFRVNPQKDKKAGVFIYYLQSVSVKGCSQGGEFFGTTTYSGCQEEPSGSWKLSWQVPYNGRDQEDTRGHCLPACSINMLLSSSTLKSKGKTGEKQALLAETGRQVWGWWAQDLAESPVLSSQVTYLSHRYQLRDPKSSSWNTIRGAYHWEWFGKGKNLLPLRKELDLNFRDIV